MAENPQLNVGLYYKQRNYRALKPHMELLESMLAQERPDPIAVLQSIEEQLALSLLPPLYAHLQQIQAHFLQSTDEHMRTERYIAALKTDLAEKDRSLAVLRQRLNQDVSDRVVAMKREMCLMLSDLGECDYFLDKADAEAEAGVHPTPDAFQRLRDCVQRLRGELNALTTYLDGFYAESYAPLRQQNELKEREIQKLRRRCAQLNYENTQLRRALELGPADSRTGAEY